MKVGFIGCGNMGTALARAVGLTKDRELFFYDTDGAKAEGVARELSGRVLSSSDMAAECDYIFLGVKPYGIHDLLTEIMPRLSSDCVLVSMAAGVSLASMNEVIPAAKIIRIMPNTPVAYGSGMVLVTRNGRVTDDELSAFLSLLAEAGRCDVIDEGLIDAGSAVSGCGPAFVYTFIDAMAEGGIRAGLSREAALEYASVTVMGAARMLLSDKRSSRELTEAVCSPGGSTIEGVRLLADRGFSETVADAVEASYKKTLILGKKK